MLYRAQRLRALRDADGKLDYGDNAERVRQVRRVKPHASRQG
jgi:hypothetical protein